MKDKVEEYIEEGGCTCLYCGSTNLDGGSIDIDAGLAWQPVYCNDCGSEWQDVYVLTQVIDEHGRDLKEVNDEKN